METYADGVDSYFQYLLAQTPWPLKSSLPATS
jgi:hypothetical protein